MKRIIILMYHIVDQALSSAEARYCCDPKNFANQMRYLRKSKYELISLNTLYEYLRNNVECPKNSVVVTFDDGFAATCNKALPVLAKYDIPSTMFIVSDRIDGTNDWMHTRDFPIRGMLSRSQVMELKRLSVCVGSHTRTHPRLTEVDNHRLLDEVCVSKKVLEDILGEPVLHFAYPFGLYDRAVRNAVEAAGYRTACSTRSGFNSGSFDHFELRRIEVYGSDSLWRFRQKLKFGTNEMNLLFPVRYYTRRLALRLGLLQ